MAEDKWNEEEKTRTKKTRIKQRKFLLQGKNYFHWSITYRFTPFPLDPDSLLICNNKLWFQQEIQKSCLI